MSEDEGVFDEEPDTDKVTDAVREGVKLRLPVAVAETVLDRVGETLTDGERDVEGDVVPVGDADAVGDGVTEADRVVDVDGDSVGEADTDPVLVSDVDGE